MSLTSADISDSSINGAGSTFAWESIGYSICQLAVSTA